MALASDFIPGGVLPTDVPSVGRDSGLCSRCFRAIREDEVPLRAWSEDGHTMYTWCEDCMGWGRRSW